MSGHDVVIIGEPVTGPGTASSGGVADDPCQRILDAIGLRRRAGDEAKLCGWLRPRLRELGLSSIDAYADLLAAGGAPGRHERELLMEHFSTGETYFFRDQGLFGLLAARILPEIVARRSAQRSLRLWSAGCASGEEAYTLAMVIDEMSPALAGWDVRILGTDINGDAIARASGGTYGQWSFRVLDEARTARYFRKCGREWQIDERLRAMVEFERRDLLQDETGGGSADAGGFDLILCRNVFIYLTPPAVTHIAGKLVGALSEGGYFVPGHGELLGCVPSGLEALTWPDATLYRRPATESAVRPAPAVPACAPSAPSVPPRTAPPATSAAGLSPRQRDSAPRPAAGPEAAPDEVLARAWRDADRGAAQAARAACERVIAVSPLDPRPYFLLAQLAEERGAIDEARTLLRKVLYLDPGFVVAHLELADLCVRTGDARRARQMRAQALRELEKMPSETPLPVPPHTTAGTLLQSLRAGDAAARGAAEGGSHG
ncbi:Chemotaxis protein methyltransferase Cher2 [Azoarcus sp. Aa7]|nr:Chemotaxis protein methyltransferase Cher2 [Azoarcus sp. Aa7]